MKSFAPKPFHRVFESEVAQSLWVSFVDFAGPNSIAMDIDMQDGEEPGFDVEAQPAYFKIALDFGTTQTSVAFMKYPEEQLPPGRRLNYKDDIFMIEDYPDAPPNGTSSRPEVPTELWFPPKKLSGSLRSSRDSWTPETCPISSDSGSEEDIEVDHAAIADMRANIAEMHKGGIRWGYGVHERIENVGIKNDDGQRIAKFKLLLDSSNNKDTEKLKKEIQAAIKDLPRQKSEKRSLGRKSPEEQIHGLFMIFFERLFEHVYEYLEEKFGFNEKCFVEPIICVPAMWQPKACRIMIKAVAEAMRGAGLFAAHHKQDPDFFIVSEAEAASTLVLEETKGMLRVGRTNVL